MSFPPQTSDFVSRADSLYPLRFRPVFMDYLWGGRRLATVLKRPIDPGFRGVVAESWEVSDHGKGMSVVSEGALEGVTLRQLMERRRHELLGDADQAGSFPLLVKWIDARQALSVQVHPNDEQARRLIDEPQGKTECWVVLEAEPGSLIYAGLKRGVDREMFRRELDRGTVDLCLHRFEPRPGDCIFVPAGTVHAIGAGLVLAEVQQTSDATFRVFDWNRLDQDGKPRALHIEQAMECIDFAAGPCDPVTPYLLQEEPVRIGRLVACDKFILDRVIAREAHPVGEPGRLHILIGIEGNARIEYRGSEYPLRRGETLVLPASLGSCRLVPSHSEGVQYLDVHLPYRPPESRGRMRDQNE